MEGLQMKYFTLKPKGEDVYAKASREAMKTYADVVCEENPKLADELIDWSNVEESNSVKKVIEIDIDEKILFELMQIAHEQDITFNQLVEKILRETIEKEIENELG
jgi:hypothetical protein